MLVAAWVAFRRGGPAVGLGASVLLAATMWSTGTATLTDPISSNMGGYPLLAGVTLAWALWGGDRRLWPLAVAVWSFTIQQHLAIFGVAGVVAAWGVLGAVVALVRRRRRDGRVTSTAGWADDLRWAAIAAVTGLVCWAPPLWDQLFGTGNLRRILAFSGADDRPTLGLDQGLRAGGRALALPPLATGRDLAGQFGGVTLIEDLGDDLTGVIAGLVTIAVVAAVIGWEVWRRRPTARARAVLLASGLVLVAGGVVTTANIPDSIESFRTNFYRWVWAGGLAVWGAAAWTVGQGIRDLVVRLRGAPAARSVAPVAAGVAVALVAVTVGATSVRQDEGDERRDHQVFRFEAAAIDAVDDAVPEDAPLRLVMDGTSAFIATGPAILAGLIERGHDVRVGAHLEAGFGERRARDPEPDEVLVQVLSGDGEVPDGRGERVLRWSLPDRPGGADNSWNHDTFEVWVLPPDAGA